METKFVFLFFLWCNLPTLTPLFTWLYWMICVPQSSQQWKLNLWIQNASPKVNPEKLSTHLPILLVMQFPCFDYSPHLTLLPHHDYGPCFHARTENTLRGGNIETMSEFFIGFAPWVFYILLQTMSRPSSAKVFNENTGCSVIVIISRAYCSWSPLNYRLLTFSWGACSIVPFECVMSQSPPMISKNLQSGQLWKGTFCVLTKYILR